MAGEDKSFADLVAEAPTAPSEGIVNLVGALAKTSETGKFVLILQDGQTITLETTAVKGHAVLGASLGRTIVRVDVEAGKFPAPQAGPAAFEPFLRNTGWLDNYTGLSDAGTTDFWRDVAATPFALATPHQAPANVVGAMNPFGVVSHMRKIPGTDTNAYADYVDTFGIDVIVLHNR